MVFQKLPEKYQTFQITTLNIYPSCFRIIRSIRALSLFLKSLESISISQAQPETSFYFKVPLKIWAHSNTLGYGPTLSKGTHPDQLCPCLKSLSQRAALVDIWYPAISACFGGQISYTKDHLMR